MSQLEWTAESAIARLQRLDNISNRYYAAWWLGQFRIREKAAIDALLIALQDTSDRSPDGGYPLRRNAARAIAKLGNCDPRLVPALQANLRCEDYYVRDEAVRALGAMGDRSCIPTLLAFLAGGPAAATPVPDKPHLREPYEATLKALGQLQARDALEKILAFRTHPVEKVQFAAGSAAYRLTGESCYLQPVLQGLEADNLALRRSALLSLGEVGYLAAADAIFATEAENSLKLIAMKGLVESALQQGYRPLSEQSGHLMALMDDLL